MNQDTIRLLEEVDKGCKMAINSMNRIIGYPMQPGLSHLINRYKYRHMELQRQVADHMRSGEIPAKEPGMMASTMARMSTEFKMFVRSDHTQVAKIMMDGCNMGIQSLSEYIHKYSQASPESVEIAGALIAAEEDFMRDLKQYL